MPTRPRVLLADDHAGIVRALERMLSLECDVVGVVADGSEVAEAAARLQPVVTVVDLNLPNVSGLEACRRILRTNPRAKVILITGMVDDDDQGGSSGRRSIRLRPQAGGGARTDRRHQTRMGGCGVTVISEQCSIDEGGRPAHEMPVQLPSAVVDQRRVRPSL